MTPTRSELSFRWLWRFGVFVLLLFGAIIGYELITGTLEVTKGHTRNRPAIVIRRDTDPERYWEEIRRTALVGGIVGGGLIALALLARRVNGPYD